MTSTSTGPVPRRRPPRCLAAHGRPPRPAARGVWLGRRDHRRVDNVRINGVDIAPLIEAELDRRDPDRPKMRPSDAAGFREAWTSSSGAGPRPSTVPDGSPPELLHERVDGEWSFIETLRHLVFATDAWVLPGGPRRPRRRGTRSTCRTTRCPTARPCRVTATPARRSTRCSRCAPTGWPPCAASSTVSPTSASRSETEPVDEPGYPEPEAIPCAECLRTVLNEEWQHRLYAERDLDALAAGHGERVVPSS